MRLLKPAASTLAPNLENGEPRPFSRPQRVLAVALALLAFGLASAATFETGFNPDESRWLSRAHYLADLADPFGPTWDDQYMTRGQPPLGSYAMGLGLLLQGRSLATNPPWDFSQTWETNIALGNEPLPADLSAGRRTSAAFVALTTLFVIAIARVFVSPPWALTAGALFAVHPFTAYIGSLAMADALFGLLIAMAGFAAAALARRPSLSRAVALGVLLGLGGATKLSPLLVAAALGAAAIMAAIVAGMRKTRSPERLEFVVALILVAVASAFASFVAVYPYLWPDPVTRTWYLFDFRSREMATQAEDWPIMAVPTRLEALRRIGANFTEHYNLAGRVASLLGASAPMPVRQIELGLAILGLAIMSVAAIRAGPLSPRFFVIALLGAQAMVTILGMRSEFDRYHLPLALLGTVSAVAGLEWLAARAASLRFGATRRNGTGWDLTKGPACGS